MAEKKELKVLVIGGGNDGHWIDFGKRISNMKEADIVVLTGGADINPSIYKEKNNSFCSYWSDQRDAREIEAYKEATELKKYIIGICRGGQLITALNGGALIQHVSHPSRHTVYTEAEQFETNSIHHQMMYPWDLPKEDFKLIGWTLGLSNVYARQFNAEAKFPEEAYNEEGLIKEPEILWYPKTRSLAIQYHPEFMNPMSDSTRFLNNFITETISQEVKV